MIENSGSGCVTGNIVDIKNREIYYGRVCFEKGNISTLERLGEKNPTHPYLLPGFVDAHIHIESSMLTPYEFARTATLHGTVATVSDPHEIANVCGMEGVLYMLDNARDARLKFNFGAPSCVPATAFETAGAVLNAEDVGTLLQRPDIRYLTEMMNYPGVLHDDPEVMQKISLAKAAGKPIDGHAPGLTGEDVIRYIQAGISTDHECFTIEEALHKLKHGMKILIREGSAARNFEALHPLISSHTSMVMFCSDDKHPDELLEGHINQVVARALNNGHNIYDVLMCACINPVEHYNLNVGLLRVNDPADFISVKNLESFHVTGTWINGEKVADNGICMLPPKKHHSINRFEANTKSINDFKVKATSKRINVIEAIDGQLVTRCIQADAKISNDEIISDTLNDVLKLTVVNRYRDEPPALAFIKNMGIKSGAFASTVAHDSHNIIAVGTDDASLAAAVNLLIESKGGLSVVNGSEKMVLPLPLAGLMSLQSCAEVGTAYLKLDAEIKSMGCKLRAPFMTLSFMALLVIPELKLSDKGLFDGKVFGFKKLFLEE